jgi:hypothetical protein
MAKLTEPSADEIEVKREILTRYIELCEALPGAAGTLKLAEACSRSSIRAPASVLSAQRCTETDLSRIRRARGGFRAALFHAAQSPSCAA